jgi:hypothetical protein
MVAMRVGRLERIGDRRMTNGAIAQTRFLAWGDVDHYWSILS